MSDKMREAFEKWAHEYEKETGYLPIHLGEAGFTGGYKAGLEEAAKACEEKEDFFIKVGANNNAGGAEACAEAIRNLITQGAAHE